MKIISLELVGFKRMALSNITRFVIKPTEPVQLILGTNGSGKSSLLLEMTPLPADPSVYYTDGMKRIEIIKDGNHYLLTSSFPASGAKHSFVMNDEELNKGGTAKVQTELASQWFSVDSQIFALFTDQERFTEMGPTRRREWFTRMSDVSYVYALKVYAQIKDEHRNLQGALKLARKRLVAESSKVISSAEEARLRQDVELTHKELTLLIEHNAPVERQAIEIVDERSRVNSELEALANRLLRMRLLAPYGTQSYGTNPVLSPTRNDWGELVRPAYTSLEQIDEYIQSLRDSHSRTQALLSKATEDHEKLQGTITVLQKTGEVGIGELQSKLDALTHKRNGLLARRTLGIEGLTPNLAKSAFDSVYQMLSEIFTEISSNEEGQFSQPKLIQAEQEREVLNQVLYRATGEVTRLATMAEHMMAHKDSTQTVCPKCSHAWSMNYSAEKHELLTRALEEAQKKVTETNDRLRVNAELIKQIGEYRELFVNYKRCERNWPQLQPLWVYLDATGYITKAPRMVVSILSQFQGDLELELSAQAVEIEIGEVRNLIALAVEAGDANLSDTRQRLSECTILVERYTFEISDLQRVLGQNIQYRKELTEALTLGDTIKALMGKTAQLTLDLIETTRRETLNHCVRQLQSSLAVKQQALNAAELQRGIIQDLEKQILELGVKEAAAGAIAKELSPTEGIIAENLLGFIRDFCKQMNALIRKIWTYPLVVKDCGSSDGDKAELDYKFPLMVDRPDNVAPDVSKGSAGMKEVVDLAFKVTAMKYLKLLQSPLFLDEFGIKFDEAHRGHAVNVIKSLIEQQPFTQLFMVSHYHASHGSFTNAEVCVISDSNITVPDRTKTNRHVVIT